MNTDNLEMIKEIGHAAEVQYGWTAEVNLSAANMAYNQILILKIGPDPHDIIHCFFLDGEFKWASHLEMTVKTLEELPDLFEHGLTHKYSNNEVV